MSAAPESAPESAATSVPPTSDPRPTVPGRLFVGNIDFEATEDDILQLFSEFNVKAVEVPTQTVTRSKKPFVKKLGYAFVNFESDDNVSEAVAKFNGHTLKLRQIFVKRAYIPPTDEERAQKLEERQRNKAKKAAAAAEAATVAAAEKTEDSAPNGDTKATAKKTKAKKSSKKAAESATNGDSAQEDSAPRAPKIPEGEKSKDTVFVTNLDYKATSRVVTTLFKDLSPVWVHVPPRRVPKHLLERLKEKKLPLFNKGIAFVKFADEETQKAAIEKFNGQEFRGRNIIVETAVDKPDKEFKERSAASEEAEEEVEVVGDAQE